MVSAVEPWGPKGSFLRCRYFSESRFDGSTGALSITNIASALKAEIAQIARKETF
jgi:hypothetical protein